MLTIGFGLGSSFLYALHDFLMVKVVRAASLWVGLTWSMGTGLAILLPLALLMDGLPGGVAEWRAVAFATAGGVCEAAGLAALLRGLVTGNLSLVSPLSSLAGGFVAVIMIAAGESLPMLALVGLPLAVAGGLMASVERSPQVATRRTRATAGAGWALLSSVLFSGTMLLFAAATSLHPVALAAYGRFGAMLVLVPVALIVAGLRLPRPLVRRSAVAGVFDAGAFVALAVAISLGPVAVASVVVAQGGTMAALLGLIVLKERLSRVQMVGVTLTCLAVALLALR